MKRFVYAVLVPVLAALVLLSGCSNDRASNTIRVGAITSLTGANAAFGKAQKVGYQIAMDELNAGGGIGGKKVELVFYDDQSKPDQAVQGVSKLVDQEHVSIILGAHSSETTRAIVPVVTQKQVPLLMPSAAAENVVETGSQWVFRICAGSNSYGTAMLDFLKHNGDPKKMAIIYENTNFGQSSNKGMTESAQAAGMQVVASEAYATSSPDYKALLQRVKAKSPDAVYFASYLLDATTLMRQSAEVNLNPKYFTSAGSGFATPEFPSPDKGAGKYAEYTLSVSQWLPSAHWKGSKEFDEKYSKVTGAHPSYQSMEAYAALLIAAEAIKAAGADATPQAIRDALKKLNLAETPFGPVKFDSRGQNAHPLLIMQVQGGQFKVVWPADAAEAKPMIPTPPWDKRL